MQSDRPKASLKRKAEPHDSTSQFLTSQKYTCHVGPLRASHSRIRKRIFKLERNLRSTPSLTQSCQINKRAIVQDHFGFRERSEASSKPWSLAEFDLILGSRTFSIYVSWGKFLNLPEPQIPNKLGITG